MVELDFKKVNFSLESGGRFMFDPRERWRETPETRKFFSEQYVKAGRLKDDEYIENDLIMCKDCHTPRMAYIDNAFGWMYCNCECQTIAEKAALSKSKRDSRIRKLKAMCFEEYPAGLDKTFANDDGRDEEVSRYARQYVEKFTGKGSKGTVLWGDTSTGKTYMATAIMNALIERGYLVRYISTAEMVRTMNDFQSSKTAFDPYRDCAAIVLDDLGAEGGNTLNLTAITRFLDKAENFKIPIIVTTNMTFADMTKAEDKSFKRIADRLLERCDFYQCKGANRRRAAAKARQAEISSIF